MREVLQFKPTEKSKVWFLLKENLQEGPFTEEEMREMINAGVLKSDVLVWKEGMPNWLSINQTSLSEKVQPKKSAPDKFVASEKRVKKSVAILLGVLSVVGVLAATVKSLQSSRKDLYTVFLGDRPLVVANPTGDSRCDEIRRDMVSKMNSMIAEENKKILKKAEDAYYNNGEAETVDGSASTKANFEALVEIGVNMALPGLKRDVKEAVNTVLRNADCLN
ncbi:MAG: DUF4339 domain-containing protein [Proteobacteria bacterium]|nr:DUF4339 domain-containing protein [Pseudomonadota bacterium]